MTKEELKKEAEEYAEQCYGWCNNDQVTDVAIATYITSAEPREKRIEELERQIKKMKCCSNCNHFNKEEDIEHCWNCERQLVNSLDNLKVEEIIKDEWEIKEK